MDPTTGDTPGERIRLLRREKGLSMEQLGNLIGVHFTTIAKIERSMRGLSSDLRDQIAKALDVAPGDIVDGAPKHKPVTMVPLLGRIAAGSWKEAVAAGDPEAWLPAPGSGPNAFGLIPDGDSMDLVVGPNSMIVVDPDQFELLDGRIYAIQNGEGESTFKRFRSDPPRLEPCSSNPMHKEIVLGREPFTVIGRVTWQASRM
ncbi:MAG TPA: XRE family transcriptional regulator [Rhizomicrobium sp.]|jgi:repressor LexA|nr:XRE family transcriptional regulator [Rhizomicrobium sp.]